MQDFGIKGLAITPTQLGRISIGKMKEHNGKRIPSKDDQITVTANFQVKKEWAKHPLNDQLLVATHIEENKLPPEQKVDALALVNTKLRSIPVKMLFNDPNLNLRAEYTAFDKNRILCKGNGKEAKRYSHENNSVDIVECNPTNCAVGEQYRCKPYTRLSVQIDGQEDELGTFTYRTTGWNSLVALQSKLTKLYALANGKLAGMPLQLVMRAKSSAQSMGSIFFYLDLEIRKGKNIVSAVQEAHKFQKEWEDLGINRDAFEEMTRQGIANGMFEDSPDEIESLLEEFYPEDEPEGQITQSAVDDLRKQLDQESEELGFVGADGVLTENISSESGVQAASSTETPETVAAE